MRWIILLGLSTRAAGMILTAVTPRQPAPGYARAALMQEPNQGRAVTALDERDVSVVRRHRAVFGDRIVYTAAPRAGGAASSRRRRIMAAPLGAATSRVLKK